MTKHLVDFGQIDKANQTFDQALIALKEVYDLDLEIAIAEQIGQLLVPLERIEEGIGFVNGLSEPYFKSGVLWNIGKTLLNDNQWEDAISIVITKRGHG